MTANEKRALDKLESACKDAVIYVGKVNYQHREDHALREIKRNFIAFEAKQFTEIEFREDTRP